LLAIINANCGIYKVDVALTLEMKK
jgi:hypothetical protein